jgi:uncharacterized protein associated with vWA-MoxR-VMAP ternary system
MSKSHKSKNNNIPTHKRGDEYIISGNVSGGIITQGRNAKVVVRQNSGADINEIESLFKQLYQHIETRPQDPNVDKEEIAQTLQKLEEETAKGEQANQTKMDRWMANLNKMAPDIVDVILASLGGPVTGITAVLKKVAEHARK